MATKRIILVGGMHFNVPRQLKEHFEIVRHYEQDETVRGQVPMSDLVLVIRNWVSHSQVKAVRFRSTAPVIWVNKGWNAMREELERRGIIEPAPGPVAAMPDEDELVVAESGAEPEPTIDPFEKMTDEELEKLTAPDPKLEEQVSNTLWGEHSRRFAIRWATETEISLTELIAFALRQKEMVNAKLVIDELHVKDFGTASRMAIGLNRTLSSYKQKTDPSYVPRDAKPVGTKSVKVPVPASDSVIPAETTGMLLNCQKKIDERNALLKKRELIDQELIAIDKEIELMKPVLDAMQALQRATRAVKDKIGARAG